MQPPRPDAARAADPLAERFAAGAAGDARPEFRAGLRTALLARPPAAGGAWARLGSRPAASFAFGPAAAIGLILLAGTALAAVLIVGAGIWAGDSRPDPGGISPATPRSVEPARSDRPEADAGSGGPASSGAAAGLGDRSTGGAAPLAPTAASPTLPPPTRAPVAGLAAPEGALPQAPAMIPALPTAAAPPAPANPGAGERGAGREDPEPSATPEPPSATPPPPDTPIPATETPAPTGTPLQPTPPFATVTPVPETPTASAVGDRR